MRRTLSCGSLAGTALSLSDTADVLLVGSLLAQNTHVYERRNSLHDSKTTVSCGPTAESLVQFSFTLRTPTFFTRIKNHGVFFTIDLHYFCHAMFVVQGFLLLTPRKCEGHFTHTDPHGKLRATKEANIHALWLPASHVSYDVKLSRLGEVDQSSSWCSC